MSRRGVRGGLAALAVVVLGLSTAAGPAAAERDLGALFPPTLPEGFVAMADQPGRLGPLDAATAAAVLDRTGRTTAEQLTRAGFVHGHARAWSKADSQEVVLDVLLEFRGDDAARHFVEGVVEARKRLEQVPVGASGAVGFRRGPATPTATEPGQLEAVLRAGPVVAIVVAAGHAAYPSPQLLTAVAAAQFEVLRPLFPERSAAKPERRNSVAGWGVPAVLMLAAVSWAAVREARVSRRAR